MRSPSSSEPTEDDDDGQILAEINITPLTDVFIVLLIIFMVVASAEVGRASSSNAPVAAALDGKLPERALEIQTPEGGGRSEIVTKDVVVSVLPDGTIFVNSQETNLAGLSDALKIARQDAPLSRNIVVRGDKSAAYDTIIRVISTAERHGFDNVSLATRTE